MTDLVQCPLCPSPGLLPSQELSKHIALLHQAEAFHCAVCKVGCKVALHVVHLIF